MELKLHWYSFLCYVESINCIDLLCLKWLIVSRHLKWPCALNSAVTWNKGFVKTEMFPLHQCLLLSATCPLNSTLVVSITSYLILSFYYYFQLWMFWSLLILLPGLSPGTDEQSLKNAFSSFNGVTEGKPWILASFFFTVLL